MGVKRAAPAPAGPAPARGLEAHPRAVAVTQQVQQRQQRAPRGRRVVPNVRMPRRPEPEGLVVDGERARAEIRKS